MNPQITKRAACMAEEADEQLFVFVGFKIDNSSKHVVQLEEGCLHRFR